MQCFLDTVAMVREDTIAPNIMLNGRQRAACRRPNTTAATPLKHTIQNG